MKRIYLIRHCKAAGQEPNAQLTEEGLRQAEQLASFFSGRPIDYMISSTYERAIASINPLAQKVNLLIHTDHRLCERVLSPEGRVDWLDKLRESFTNMDLKLSGGESSREAMDRGVAVLNELIERSEKSIAVVTHGNLMSLILKHFDDCFGFDEWRGLTNPDVYELVLPGTKEDRRINRIWR